MYWNLALDCIRYCIRSAQGVCSCLDSGQLPAPKRQESRGFSTHGPWHAACDGRTRVNPPRGIAMPVPSRISRTTSSTRRWLLAAAAAAAAAAGLGAPAHAQDTLKLGLVAAMSGQSA